MRVIPAWIAATLGVAAALIAPETAAAAPTCTSGDLQLRVGYQCDLGPALGVTPGHQCTWYWTGNRYDVRSGCRY